MPKLPGTREQILLLHYCCKWFRPDVVHRKILTFSVELVYYFRRQQQKIQNILLQRAKSYLWCAHRENLGLKEPFSQTRNRISPQQVQPISTPAQVPHLQEGVMCNLRGISIKSWRAHTTEINGNCRCSKWVQELRLPKLVGIFQ